DRIQKKYKLDVENLIFITEKAKLKNNQIFYRLLVGRFKSNDDAKSFCKKLNFNKSCIIKIIE
ncbi:SPOR domain-containing protein, partial [Alphaproteobacteria bacterium]|nr:SPOR domain-containing protein [Alphaproteobacteria bacterium]